MVNRVRQFIEFRMDNTYTSESDYSRLAECQGLKPRFLGHFCKQLGKLQVIFC